MPEIIESSVGVKVGSGTERLVGFHGNPGSPRRKGAVQAALIDNTGGNASDSTLVAAAVTPVADQSGGSAPDDTIEVVTMPVELTDSTGGSASGTLANITDTGGAADVGPVKDAIASLAAGHEGSRIAILALRDAVATLAGKVNAIISDTTTNDNMAKLAVLVNELRASLVEKNLIKGAA